MKSYLPLFLFTSIAISTSATDLTSIVESTIKGGSTGSIDLSIGGGVSPYQISWAGPNGFSATTEDLANLGVGTYTVTVTDTYCGIATTTIIITDFLTSIDEMNDEQISIFPNPTIAAVEIKVPDLFRSYNFRILNALGKLVMEKENVMVSSFTVDLKDVNAGMYFMEIIQGSQLYRKKVMKY
jgi:hypothetical protein